MKETTLIINGGAGLMALAVAMINIHAEHFMWAGALIIVGLLNLIIVCITYGQI